MLKKNRNFHLVFIVTVCMNFFCSEFNNPIKPTYPVNCYYSQDRIEIAVLPSKVFLQRNGLNEFPEKDVPLVVLNLKTNTDFSKEYQSLNEKNSDFIYTILLDSIISSNRTSNNQSSIYQYKIVLSSPDKESSDTSYYKSSIYLYLEIFLNNTYMNNPKQFLWQARLNLKETYILPPKPYAYIIPSIIH